jgi:hypothetical protein
MCRKTMSKDHLGCGATEDLRLIATGMPSMTEMMVGSSGRPIVATLSKVSICSVQETTTG